MKDFFSPTHQQLISQVSATSSPTSNAPSTQPPSAQDVWRDPVWQSLGVIIGAALALIAILISLKQWQRKSLVYEVVSKENIVKVADNSIGSELQISYQGKPVKDLHLVTIKFINSGNTEIRPEDYVRQISLSFGEHSGILGNKLIEQEPSNLDVNISHDKSKEILLINPVLLNKKDFFTVQVLVTGFQGVNPNGRIAGVKRIREVTALKLDSETLAVLVGLVVATTGALSSVLTLQTNFLNSELIVLLFVALLSTVVGFVVNQLPPYKIKKK